MERMDTTPTAKPKCPGWAISFGLATALLLVVNVIATCIGVAWGRWVFCTVALFTVVRVGPLRTLLLKGMVVALGLACILFVAKNLGGIVDGRLGASDAIVGIVRELGRVGPGRQLRWLVRTLTDAKRSALESTPDAGSSPRVEPEATPDARYDRYLRAVDHRSPAVNAIASKLTRGCGTGDHLCESSRILRFVTDRVEYRSDPRGRGDYVKQPMQTYESMAGDCEDKTILFVSLLESVGGRTLMAFEPRHTYPMVCFSEPLPAMLRSSAGIAASRAMDLQTYLAAPWNGSRLVEHASSATSFSSGGRACYPVETTDEGSWIGHAAHTQLVGPVFDPVERREVSVWPPLRLFHE